MTKCPCKSISGKRGICSEINKCLATVPSTVLALVCSFGIHKSFSTASALVFELPLVYSHVKHQTVPSHQGLPTLLTVELLHSLVGPLVIVPGEVVSEVYLAIVHPAFVRLFSGVSSHVVCIEHFQLKHCSTLVADKCLDFVLL